MFTILTLSPDSASNGLYTVLVSIHSVEVLKKTWEVVVDSMVGALGSFFFFFFCLDMSVLWVFWSSSQKADL